MASKTAAKNTEITSFDDPNAVYAGAVGECFGQVREMQGYLKRIAKALKDGNTGLAAIYANQMRHKPAALMAAVVRADLNNPEAR